MAFYRGYCIFIARIFSPPYEGPDIIAFLTQFFRPYGKGDGSDSRPAHVSRNPNMDFFGIFFVEKSISRYVIRPAIEASVPMRHSL